MLGKLIKYDIVFGIKKYAFMAALTAALLIFAVIAYLFDNNFISGLFIVLAVVATIAYSVMYLVVSIQHLYKQLCSRESYLSYALPVPSHSLVLSKILAILFWGVVTCVVVILFWLAAVDGMVLAQSGTSLRSWWDTASGIVRAQADFDLAEIVVKSFVIGVIQFLMCVCLAVFCVSLSNVPYLKERNLGVATGVIGFIVMYNIASLFPTLVMWLKERAGGVNIFDDSAIQTGAEVSEIVTSLTWTSGIIYAVFAVLFFFLAVRMVDRHRFIG